MWPFDYFRAQSAGHRLQQALFEQSIQMFNANTMPGDFQRDAAAWAQTYETLTDQPVVLSESQHRDVQLRAYRFYKYNPWARGVVSSFRKYIYGLGSLVVIGDKSLQEKWDRWAKACNWNGRVRDLITRTFRDGEAFIPTRTPTGARRTGSRRNRTTLRRPWRITWSRRRIARCCATARRSQPARSST